MVGPSKLSILEQKKVGYLLADSQIEGALGPYALLTEFGGGGQGHMRYCKNAKGELFVVKFFPLMKIETDSFNLAKRLQISAFSAELTAYETFFHTGIEKVPKFRDIGRTSTGSIPFIVMERLGPNLNVMLKANGYMYFTTRSALKLVYQLVLCLEAIHSVKIVHRDIKPRNFCFSRDPISRKIVVKIIDFGFSKVYNPASIGPLLDKGSYGSIGTVEFSSRASHLTSDLTPFDDLESLFYMITSFFRGDRISWNRHSPVHTLFNAKTKFWKRSAFGCNQLNAIFKHIKGLKREDDIHYEKLKNVILEQFDQLTSEQDKDTFVAVCQSCRRTITEQLDNHYSHALHSFEI